MPIPFVPGERDLRPDAPRLLAISDLHAGHLDNRRIIGDLRPAHPGDWLIVAGDVADSVDDTVRVLGELRARFARVLWVPGNHELLAAVDAPAELRGEARYRQLVERLRALHVDTPEDPYPVWEDATGPTVIAPLFTLYDYGFGARWGASKEERLRLAHEARVVCVDEYLLDPAPYASREEWCTARVAETERRLAAIDPSLPTVLINHWPLIEDPTFKLHLPEFALWCGTPQTADWPARFRARACVYGHLHIGRRHWNDGVRFEEVSLGYPREWKKRFHPPGARVILPWARERDRPREPAGAGSATTA